MYNFELGIVAEYRMMQNYEVFCNRCDDSLGTMDIDTIRSAIWNTLARGGVLCPTCRKRTCDTCGKIAISGNYRKEKGLGQARLCFVCMSHRRTLNEKITNEHLWEAGSETRDISTIESRKNT